MIALLGAALAATPCLDAVGFRSLVVDAQRGVDRGDVELTQQVLAQFEAQVPCLGYAPEPRLWAELLVVYAVIAFTVGEDWQAPLSTALRIRPALDRGVARGHPLFAWQPPPAPPATLLPAPAAGHRLYVDGARDGTWVAGGWHLLQKTDGQYWESALARDTVDGAWIAAPVKRPPRLVWTVAGHLHAGGVALGQAGSPNNWGAPEDTAFSPHYALADRQGLGWGVNAAGLATLRGFGLSGRVATLWDTGPGIRDARVSAVWTTPHTLLGAGVGFTDVLWRRALGPHRGGDRDLVWETRFERFLHVEAGFRFGRRFVVEGTGLVGARSRHTWSALAEGWFTFPEQRWLPGARLRVGGQAGWTVGRLELVELPDAWMSAWTLRVTPSAGVVVGEFGR